MTESSAGGRFRAAMREEKPLQIVGAINANHALLAKRAGFKAIYLSGGGVAAGSLGLPDLGISGLEDVSNRCKAHHRRVRRAAPRGCRYRALAHRHSMSRARCVH